MTNNKQRRRCWTPARIARKAELRRRGKAPSGTVGSDESRLEAETTVGAHASGAWDGYRKAGKG